MIVFTVDFDFFFLLLNTLSVFQNELHIVQYTRTSIHF